MQMWASGNRSTMILDWQVHTLEPAGPPSGQEQLRTMVGLGPAARQAIAGLAPGTKLVLGIEIAADGTIAASRMRTLLVLR